MIIRHNLPAMNTWRSTFTNTSNTAKNLEKLSSGFRINRAADDASGLAISEKMRAQISALTMAEKNVMDGINLIKVADGGLNEVHNMLRRMYELSIQATNGTYGEVDRQAIREEITQLTSEINKQASSMKFNNVQLYGGAIRGDYEYAYGLKQAVMETPTDPARIYAGEAFEGPLRIIAGSNAELSRSSDLDALGGPPPHFPLEGIFAIRVQDPEAGTVDAVLDFSAVNAAGDFSLADFEQFFKDELGHVADFSIGPDGTISVKATGLGGSGSRVTIGVDNASSLGLPAGTKIVNSSIFGAARNGYSYESAGVKTTRALTQAEVTALQSPFGGFDRSLVMNSTLLWDLLPAGTTFSYGIEERVEVYPTYPYEKWDPISGTEQSFSKSGNLTGAANLADVNAYLGNSTNNNSYFTATGVEPYLFTDREGYVYVNFYGSASVVPEYASNPPYRAAFGYSPETSDYNASSYSPTITSTYPAAVSEEIGTLSITINDVPGVSPAPSVTVDFSSMDFSTTQDMVDYINSQLNVAANRPVPPPVFTNSTYDSAFPVAEAYLDYSGRLVVRAAEYGFGISISESESDRPMYSTSAYTTAGVSLANPLIITDDSGHETAINIKAGNFADIDDFIRQNAGSFSPDYILSKDETGQSLVITSVGEGDEYTVGNIRFAVYPSNSANDAYAREIFSKLGFDSFACEDGVTHPPIPGKSNALWIQSGASSDEGLFIGIPCLDAYDLGLMIMAEDHANSGEYKGISKIGTAAYTAVANVGPEPMGYSLDVTTQEKANAAVDILKNAINIISSERAQLGAIQNRLEHTFDNIGVVNENLQATESKIRDTDMAKEMMAFTKNNILMQSAQAMLAQANIMPQGILALLG